MRDSNDITRALEEAGAEAPGAIERLIELVRDDLRRRAAHQLRVTSAPQTLEPTALVHEAYIRIFSKDKPQNWANRGHFYMAASRAMHDVLVERARAASRKKRGGDHKRVPLHESSTVAEQEALRFLELHETLETLRKIDQTRATIVRLRFYCGLTNLEIAEALGCAERTVRREWAVAKLWLRDRLGHDPADISRTSKF